MQIDNRKPFQSLLILVGVTLLTLSCSHESDMLDSFAEVCFESDVLPVFQNSCGISGCHDGNEEANYILTSFDGIRNSVVAGDPDASPSYLALTLKGSEGMMPPGQPLSQTNRTLIRLWIYQGANNTVCPDITGGTGGQEVPVNPKACFTRDILPVLISSCASTGCHDVATHEAGLIYTSYANTMGSVRAGNPGESKLYKVITTTSGEDRMPPLPYAHLTSAAIDSVFSWIKNGALNEVCGEVCDTISPVTYTATLWPVIQNSCLGCHTGTSAGGGVRLDSYAAVAVTAGNGSLLGSLKGTAPYSKMPPAGSLTDCKITQFSKWIENGYLNN